MFPVLAPAPLRVLGGGVMGTRIKAYLCIQCTTGEVLSFRNSFDRQLILFQVAVAKLDVAITSTAQ